MKKILFFLSLLFCGLTIASDFHFKQRDDLLTRQCIVTEMMTRKAIELHEKKNKDLMQLINLQFHELSNRKAIEKEAYNNFTLVACRNLHILSVKNRFFGDIKITLEVFAKEVLDRFFISFQESMDRGYIQSLSIESEKRVEMQEEEENGFRSIMNVFNWLDPVEKYRFSPVMSGSGLNEMGEACGDSALSLDSLALAVDEI